MKKIVVSGSFVILLIFIIGVMSYKVIFYDVLLIDTIISNFVNNIRCDWLDFFMKFITSFGNTTTIIILLSLVLWLLIKMINNKKMAMFFLGSMICNVFLNQGIKFLIRRDRPIYSLIDVGGFSFPSGHAMVSMAFYGFLIYLFYRLINKKMLRFGLITIFSLLILLIGFSRIYLGVHYFSDVVVGFSISLLYLFFCCKLIKKFKIIT